MNTNTECNTRCVSYYHHEDLLGRPQKKLRHVSSFETVAVLNDHGLSEFRLGKYERASKYFSQALSRLQTKQDSSFEDPPSDIESSCSEEASSYTLPLEKTPENTSTSHEYDEGLHLFDGALPVNNLESFGSIASIIFYNIGQVFVRRRRVQTAITWFERSLEQSTQTLNTDTVLMALHNLGYCNYRCGQNNDALQYFESALSIISHLDESDLTLAATLNCVGVLYFHEPIGDTEKSIQFFQQSLKAYRSCETYHGQQIATLLNNIGRVHYLRSNFEEARDLYVEVLKIRRTVLGGESMDLAATYYHAGQTLHQTGDLETALEYYNHFLRIGNMTTSSSTREMAIVYKRIGEIHRERSQLNCSLQAYRTSLMIARSSMGHSHPEVAAVLNKAGNLCYEMGMFDDALRYYLEGLEIEKTHLTPNDPHLIITLTNIAHVHKHRGDHAKALVIYRHVYMMQVKACGNDCVDIAGTLSSIGLMQYHMREFEAAFRSYQEALSVRRDHFKDEDHVDVASTLNSLGLVLFKQEMYDMAKECFFEALQVRRKLLGANHHDIAISWYNIATIYFESGEDDKAVEFYKEALRVERASLGPDHPDVVLTLQHLGRVLQQLGLLSESAKYFMEALEIEENRVERNLRSEAKLLNRIGNLHLQCGDVETMMQSYIKASRMLKDCHESDDTLVITGYNYYGLSKMHPPCAATA